MARGQRQTDHRGARRKRPQTTRQPTQQRCQQPSVGVSIMAQHGHSTAASERILWEKRPVRVPTSASTRAILHQQHLSQHHSQDQVPTCGRSNAPSSSRCTARGHRTRRAGGAEQTPWCRCECGAVNGKRGGERQAGGGRWQAGTGAWRLGGKRDGRRWWNGGGGGSAAGGILVRVRSATGS